MQEEDHTPGWITSHSEQEKLQKSQVMWWKIDKNGEGALILWPTFELRNAKDEASSLWLFYFV